MYLEPWHFDIFDFLELKKNTGKEEQRARDLFYALWIPDLFMKRVETNGVNAAHKTLNRYFKTIAGLISHKHFIPLYSLIKINEISVAVLLEKHLIN